MGCGWPLLGKVAPCPSFVNAALSTKGGLVVLSGKTVRRTLMMLLGASLLSPPARAYLTSDVMGSWGMGSNTIQLSQTRQVITSNASWDFSYNAYFSPIRSAFILNFTEYGKSNIGELNFIRMAAGLRWYIYGFNGDRFIFDSQVEGRVFRPAPFWSFTIGASTLSVPLINEDRTQYFNAMSFDWELRAGIEVPLSRSYYLVSQLGLLNAFPSYNVQTEEHLSYQALSLFVGLKAMSF